jgi:outer membrane protein OmpA-like peptidoglycan-associated protein
MRAFCIIFLFIIPLVGFAQDGGKTAVRVKLFDESISPISADIEAIDNETKELYTKIKSDDSGDATLNLPTEKSYILFFSKSGYLFQSVIVTPADSASTSLRLKDVILSKIELGKKTILSNVSFDELYQNLMLEESLPDIDRIVKLLNDQPQLQIELGGHTDPFGSISLQRKTSEQRAKTLGDMLVSKGVNEARLVYKGYGSTMPIASNFTQEGIMKNKRVELKIMSLNFVAPAQVDTKKKKGTTKKTDVKPDKPEDDPVAETDTVKADKVVNVNLAPDPTDTLLKIDYKGMFIADKKPLANSTVNLLTDQGTIFKTTKTDENGSFQFVGVPAEKELTLGLDSKETKKYKKVQLADTAGVVVQDLEKVNGEFVHKILPSEKVKLGKVYIADPELKLKKLKKKTTTATGNGRVIGRVVDDNNSPIKAEIEIVDYTTGTTMKKLSSQSTSGDFSVDVAVGRTYDIAVTKVGYSFQTINIIIPDTVGYERNVGDISLQKIEAGKKIILNNIFFDVNQSTLRKESYAELARALKFMNDLTSMTLEISGHTDNVGSSKANKTLSEERAKSVMDYMIANGADKSRLKYKGYGSSKPVASNQNDAGRQLNRRTEFKVLQVDLTEVKTKQDAAATAAPDPIDNTGNSNDVEKSTSPLVPERYKRYDLDKDNTVSYEEVIKAIDLYFDEHPTGNAKQKEELNGLFDYYFDK